MLTISESQLRLHRLYASGLYESPHTHVCDVLRTLVAVQSQQEFAGAYSVTSRVRVDAQTVADAGGPIHYVRGHAPSAVRSWGIRHTMHIFERGVWPLMSAALLRKSRSTREMLQKRDVPYNGYRSTMDDIERHCERAPGPHSTTALASLKFRNAKFRRGGVYHEEVLRYDGAVHTLVAEGRLWLCAAKMGSANCFQWAEDADARPGDFDESARVLLERYLVGHGPADAADFAYWSGFGVLVARACITEGLESGTLVRVRRRLQSDQEEGEEEEEEEEEEGGGRERRRKRRKEEDPLVCLARGDHGGLDDTLRQYGSDECAAEALASLPVRLLGKFDPLLMGYADKPFWFGEEFVRESKRVWTTGGFIQATVLYRGKVEGVWRTEENRTRIVVELFRDTAHLRSLVCAAVRESVAGLLVGPENALDVQVLFEDEN